MRSAGINPRGRCSSYFAVPVCFLCVWFYFHWDQWQKLLRFPVEENLALRQRRVLFIAADNDSFTIEQQCGYNSTLPRNVYDYFHRRKYSVAFCSSFRDPALKCCIQSLVTDSHFTSVASSLDFNIYFLGPYLSGLIILFGMFKY